MYSDESVLIRHGSNTLSFELFNLNTHPFQAIVIYIRDFFEPRDITSGRFGDELPTRVTENVYRVVVVIVSDLVFSSVKCLPLEILRHVNSGRICILRLNCVLPISPYSFN